MSDASETKTASSSPSPAHTTSFVRAINDQRDFTIMPGASLQSDDESACRVSSEAWEQRLHEAESLDQIRSIMDDWRADESVLEPDLDSLCFYESLVAAFHRGDVPLVKYFLEEGVPITYTLSCDALSGAVPESKRPEILEALYQHGWDLNKKSPWRFTILSDSVRNEEAVRWLLDHGADPNPKTPIYCVPISIAARDASLDTIKLLLEKGADPTRSIALKYAIMRDDEHWKTVIEILLDHGCDINDTNTFGVNHRGRPRTDPGTVLHSAALWNRHHVIPFLLEKGADPLKVTETGLTPAQYALENGSEEAASVLAEEERQCNARQGEI